MLEKESEGKTKRYRKREREKEWDNFKGRDKRMGKC
jgi:hypothetical protein